MFIIAQLDQSLLQIDNSRQEESSETNKNIDSEPAINYSAYIKSLEDATKVLKEQEEIIAKERAIQAEKDAVVDELKKQNE